MAVAYDSRDQDHQRNQCRCVSYGATPSHPGWRALVKNRVNRIGQRSDASVTHVDTLRCYAQKEAGADAGRPQDAW